MCGHAAAASAVWFAAHESEYEEIGWGVSACIGLAAGGLCYHMTANGSLRKAKAKRTRGGTLAGGATRVRGATGSGLRAAMSSPAPLPFEIHLSAERGELQKVVSKVAVKG